MIPEAKTAPDTLGEFPTRPYRYFLEVQMAKDQVTQFLWSESLHGAPTLVSLRQMVDAHNLSREREALGRAPWWVARIMDRKLGIQVASYKPMDGIGRRVKL